MASSVTITSVNQVTTRHDVGYISPSTDLTASYTTIRNSLTPTLAPSSVDFSAAYVSMTSSLTRTASTNQVASKCSQVFPDTGSTRRCSHLCYNRTMMTNGELMAYIRSIRVHLALDKSKLIKTILKYNSMKDPRPSATYIGSAWILLLVTYFSIFILSDTCLIIRHFSRSSRRRIEPEVP